VRLVTWNCCGGFAKKYPALAALNPDIAVVPEVTERSLAHAGILPDVSVRWHGVGTKKGVATLGFNGWRIQATGLEVQEEFVVPLVAIKAERRFFLYAVWAKPYRGSHEEAYIGRVYRALDRFESRMDASTIILGDFNASAIWDKERKVMTFSAVADRLAKLGLRSAYHTHTGETYGAEADATFYLWRKRERAYHIDYCFLGADVMKDIPRVTVGTYGDWMDKSDHCPIIVDGE
jgi:exodeoxyribonuclease-3